MNRRTLGSFTSNPIVIFASMAVAVALGIFAKPFALALAPAGNLYVDLLAMCVVPILFSIVALSIMKLMISPNARRYAIRMVAVVPAIFVLFTAISIVVSVAVQPGARIDTKERASLGIAVSDRIERTEIALDTPPAPQPSQAQQIVAALVPQNVFAALASGDALKILFFAVVLGIALGVLYGAHYHAVYELIEEVYHAFYQILTWIIVALPLGLLCIMASETARIDDRVFAAMWAYLVAFVAIVTVLCVGAIAVIAALGRVPFGRAAAALRPALLLGFSTRNSFACIPLAVSALHVLNFENDASELMVPFAISFCRFANAAYFTLAAFFAAQLYGLPLDVGMSLAIAGLAIVAGIASAGSMGIASLLPLGLVMHSAGLPFDAVLVLFIAVDPVIDPFRSMLQVAAGAVAAAGVAGSRYARLADSSQEAVT
jgi:proton glutamate symport protein